MRLMHDKRDVMENINWYPGHMKKTRDLIKENLKMVDAVVEILDARIPASSQNPVISELTAGKTRIVVLNKSDLADEQTTAAWVRSLEEAGVTALPMNCEQGEGVKRLLKIMSDIQAAKSEGRGPRRPLRLMIVGIPNVGKS